MNSGAFYWQWVHFIPAQIQDATSGEKKGEFQ